MSRRGSPLRALALTGAGAAGLGALVLGGALPPWVAALALVLVAAAPWLRPPLHRVAWPLLTLPVLAALLLAVLLASLSLRAATSLGLTYLLVHRHLARAGPGDDRLGLGISGVMLAASASGTDAPLFLGAAALWALCLPVGLLGAQLDGWRLRAPFPALPWAGAALATPLLAALLFPLLPRLGPHHAPPAEARALTGFDGEVELGEVATLFTSDEPVFRAWVETAAGAEVPGPMYFRGVVLDHFDGHRWTRTARRDARQQPTGEALARAPAGGYRILIDEEPVAEGVLFTMGQVVRLGADFPVEHDADGNWFLPGPPRRVEYVLQAMPPLRPGEGPDPRLHPTLTLPMDLERWTALPDSLDPRVYALAAEVAGEAPDAWGAVTALREYLRTHYRYTREAPAPADDPLADFLFVHKQGHCEYFASALAVLVRARGLPARLVNGFVGGERNEVGGYWQFRRHHAHSWVEVYLLGLGWVYVDATPGPTPPRSSPSRLSQTLEALQSGWYAGVLDYDASVQEGALFRAGRRVEAWLGAPAPADSPQLAGPPWRGVALLVLLALTAAALGARPLLGLLRRLTGARRAHRARGPVARLYHRAVGRIARQGWEAPPHLPPVAAARWLAQVVDPALAPLEELAWLHYRVRYGGEDEARLLARATALERSLRRVRLR